MNVELEIGGSGNRLKSNKLAYENGYSFCLRHSTLIEIIFIIIKTILLLAFNFFIVLIQS